MSEVDEWKRVGGSFLGDTDSILSGLLGISVKNHQILYLRSVHIIILQSRETQREREILQTKECVVSSGISDINRGGSFR